MERTAVVTVVHGTIIRILGWPVFGRASWTIPESPLLAAIAQRWPTAHVEVFEWSGRNSHRSRREASESLRRHIESSWDEFRDSDHFIIAHSHGGNVALYALRDLNFASRRHIRGVVCIATPFIRCHHRDVARQRRRLFVCAYAGTILWALLFFVSALPPLVRGVSAVLAGIGVVGLTRLMRTSLEQLRQTSDGAGRRLHAHPPDGIPFLCIRSVRDEAALWLDTVSSVCGMMNWIWDWAYSKTYHYAALMGTTAKDWWEESTQKMPAGCLVALLLINAPFIAVALAFLLITPLGAAVALAVYVAVATVMGAHIVTLLTILTRASPWGFGESWLLNWLVDIKSAPAPALAPVQSKAPGNDAGLITLFNNEGGPVTPPSLEDCVFQVPRVSLNHVRVLREPSVVCAIVEWLERRSGLA
jgi:hypothetical protein